ncbi:DUF3592 domain-containing protein [Arthrobacter sp. B6]|uniref:DUF3592 domain-containing protein n=1 Tax=Arthrobacter sp. B6 TaxID=1570137 RepID=UPI0008327314|nr:DUF3592 domain-containing protein [Arthrobacter sp. B6]
MPTALDMAGPILEMLTWLCLPAGLMLLVYAGILRRFVNPWVVAEGVVYKDASGTGFRWFDHKYRIHHAPMSPHDIKGMAVGDTLPIYYHPKRPTQWQTAVPEAAGRTAVVVGRLLTGVGTVALIAGFFLPMF